LWLRFLLCIIILMEYVSAKQKAQEWGRSERRVTRLCNLNLIPGAVKDGKGLHGMKTWRIPSDAEKPIDRRITNGVHIKPQKPREIKSLINNVHKGSCLVKMREIPDHSIDLILCDLPYRNFSDWGPYIPFNKLWMAYKRIIKPNGVIALFGAEAFTGDLISSNREWFKYKWVWVKSRATNHHGAGRMPLREHEDICIFWAPGAKPVFNYEAITKENGNHPTDTLDFTYTPIEHKGISYPADNILEVTVARDDKDEPNTFHVMQKPLKLMRYLVRAYTNPGDLVLDNACGAGPAIVAALYEGRNFIGIDKDIKEFKNKQNIRYSYIDTCESYLHNAWHSLNQEERKKLVPSALLTKLTEWDQNPKCNHELFIEMYGEIKVDTSPFVNGIEITGSYENYNSAKIITSKWVLCSGKAVFTDYSSGSPKEYTGQYKISRREEEYTKVRASLSNPIGNIQTKSVFLLDIFPDYLLMDDKEYVKKKT